MDESAATSGELSENLRFSGWAVRAFEEPKKGKEKVFVACGKLN